ncbi:hypothetical protein [Kitasatospora sp. NPDC057500]|uniref:hypothetical protein n=1 Tax=Kitasatospora sp. NPDC057500 TaxID=3346151 RepID=UPI003699E53D
MTPPARRSASAITPVRLLAGHASAGQPVSEVLPAVPLEAGERQLAGSPGPAPGCAAGDVLAVGRDTATGVEAVMDVWAASADGASWWFGKG